MRGNSCVRFGISKADRCDVRRSVPTDHAEYGEVETACSIILANFFERQSRIQEELGKRHPFGFPTMSWTPSASTASSRASGLFAADLSMEKQLELACATVLTAWKL